MGCRQVVRLAVSVSSLTPPVSELHEEFRALLTEGLDIRITPLGEAEFDLPGLVSRRLRDLSVVGPARHPDLMGERRAFRRLPSSGGRVPPGVFATNQPSICVNHLKLRFCPACPLCGSGLYGRGLVPPALV